MTPVDRKARVRALHAEVLGACRLDLLPTLCAEGYAVHTPDLRGSPRLESGLAALRARLAARGRIPNEIKHLIEDGDIVCAHVRYGTPVPTTGCDIYRFDADDRIVEHWTMRQPIPHDAERGHDRFATTLPPPAKPLDAQWLRDRVRSMITDMWMKGDVSLVPSFYDPTYIQHNPDMPGGFERIRQVVERDIRGYMQRTGGPFPVQIHRIAAEGDLVFINTSLFMAGINRNDGDRSTNLDIFRVNADGRMTEHWDVLQMERESREDDPSIF